jgi:hypothetical protein
MTEPVCAKEGDQNRPNHFPSRQIITEHLISHTGQKHIKYRVIIYYEECKFFTVETDVKYLSESPSVCSK